MRAMYTFPRNYDQPQYRIAPLAMARLATTLLEGGDASYHFSSGVPERIGQKADFSFGYAVGGAARGLENPTHDELVDWLKKNLLIGGPWYSNGTVVGAWTDPETGTLYIDIADRHLSLADATRAAQQRDEIAFWDWKRRGSHTLTERGGLRFDPAVYLEEITDIDGTWYHLMCGTEELDRFPDLQEAEDELKAAREETA